MTIKSKPPSKEYDAGWDRIFGKRKDWKEQTLEDVVIALSRLRDANTTNQKGEDHDE